jgi:hypothetical protein
LLPGLPAASAAPAAGHPAGSSSHCGSSTSTSTSTTTTTTRV